MGSSHQMAPQTDILIQLVVLLSDDSLEIATRSERILVTLGKSYSLFWSIL